MSSFDSIKSAILEFPISDLLKARLELAADYSADVERKNDVLQVENGKLQAKLEAVTLDLEKCREQYQRLQDEHAEEVRIHTAVEFRRGKRTGGQWMAFCPSCHAPARMWQTVRCSLFGERVGCHWITMLGEPDITRIAGELG